MANLPLDFNTPSIRLHHDDGLYRMTPTVSSFYQTTIPRTPLSNCQPKYHQQQPAPPVLHSQHLQKASILQKRHQIERERALIDLELRRLELEEQKSRCKFDKLHLDDRPRTDTATTTTTGTSTARTKHQPLGKMLAAAHLSKRTWDSSTITKEMSVSSSSSSSSSDDEELKLRQLLVKQQRRSDSVLIKEIVVQYSAKSHDEEGDDNNSVTSLLTLPLAPWEELEQLIQADEKAALDNAQRMGPPRQLDVPSNKMDAAFIPQNDSRKHSSQQRKKQGQFSHYRPPIHRTLLSPPPRQASFRNKLDKGDEHPGRVKNMPLMIKFPKDHVDNNYYFSPQWLHSSSSVQATYTGPLRQGLPYGIAILRFDNGDMYMGEVVWGEMHGQGTYRTRRGQVWRGMFAHNVFVGNDAPATQAK